MSKHWFLPKNPDLLGLLGEQATITVSGMHALVAWAAGEPGAGDQLRNFEHQADEKKRQLWRELRDAFSPPIDAEDLYALSSDLDEVLNAAKDLVRELEVMELAPDAATHEMAVLLADATQSLSDAFARLGTPKGDAMPEGDATESADAAIKSTRRVEHVYRAAMSQLLRVDDLREVMARREVYRRLSRIGDHILTVADRVWYAVMKEA